MNEPQNTNQDTRPQMSSTEASWHETQAGLRAKEHAAEQGGDLNAQVAIADVTSKLKVVGRYTLKPVSQGTVHTLKKVASEFEAYAIAEGIHTTGDMQNPGMKELLELGIAVLVFADVKRCYSMSIDDLRYEAEDLIFDMPLEESMELSEHFNVEMARMNTLSGNEEAPPAGSMPGKPQTPPLVQPGASSPFPVNPHQAMG